MVSHMPSFPHPHPLLQAISSMLNAVCQLSLDCRVDPSGRGLLDPGGPVVTCLMTELGLSLFTRRRQGKSTAVTMLQSHFKHNAGYPARKASSLCGRLLEHGGLAVEGPLDAGGGGHVGLDPGQGLHGGHEGDKAGVVLQPRGHHVADLVQHLVDDEVRDGHLQGSFEGCQSSLSLSVCRSFGRSVCLFVCLSVGLSVCLSVGRSVCLSVCLRFPLSRCL